MYQFVALMLLGQITMPDKIEAYKPIVAGCNCIVPQNGEAMFVWSWDKNSNAMPDSKGSPLNIWAPPRQHSVSLLAIAKVYKEVEDVKPDPADTSNPANGTLESLHVN